MLLLTRTMEIYRSLGLSEEIEKESERYFYIRPLTYNCRCYDSAGGVLAMECLAAETAIDTYLPTLNHRVHELSPARRVFLTHHMLIRILQRRAKSMPLITLRYNCSVLSITQFAKKVTAQTSFGSIIARYCVGCDGSHGITRKLVNGGNMAGIGLLTKSLTIAFRVPIRIE
jgi:2-polyprenyl-6-methoxyphenol hydroxylase-like FAD-dependent oxidoreductase